MSLPLERTDFVLRDTVVVTQFLDVIQTWLAAFASLQKVRVHVNLLGWDLNDEVNDGVEDSVDDRWRSHRVATRALLPWMNGGDYKNSYTEQYKPLGKRKALFKLSCLRCAAYNSSLLAIACAMVLRLTGPNHIFLILHSGAT